jgi:hypothetical protein
MAGGKALAIKFTKQTITKNERTIAQGGLSSMLSKLAALPCSLFLCAAAVRAELSSD